MHRLVKYVFLAWIVLWVIFDIRPLVKNSYFRQYCALIGKSQEDRRALVYGKDLLVFLNYAKGVLPQGATYKLLGVDEGSVDRVRAYYHLYPNSKSDRPQFILAYHLGHFKEPGYTRFSAMNEQDSILKLE